MSSKVNEWSKEEKDLLIKFFPTMGSEYCSKLINRSKRGCQEMAKKLKLKRSFGYENEEKVRDLVNSCKTYTECVIKLGLSPRCSGNFQTIKKYIRKYSIDISHFDGGQYKIGNKSQNEKELDEVLVKNSFFNRRSLKQKLYKKSLKKKECEICGMGEDWYNGSKIVHILDHINGDPYDNRIENLRIVCPNCNSTLETNCRGNKIKKIYDSEKDEYKSEKIYKKCYCGKVILKNSKMCSKCNGEKHRKNQRPDYEILKKLVDENGNTGVGKMYGVTEACIRKWIRKYEIENTSVT